MPQNKVAEANKAFSKTIQKALSTLTASQWQVLNHPEKGGLVRLYTLMPPLVLKNNAGKSLYKLTAYIVTEAMEMDDGSGKRVKTREYIYQIASNADGKALYEFHWHPEKIDRATLEPAKRKVADKTPFPFPHAHVRAKDSRFVDLNKRHIPSGRIAFEDVIAFLISDCGVKPNRQDWQKTVLETRKHFDKTRNW
jgi:hypothetical protein